LNTLSFEELCKWDSTRRAISDLAFTAPTEIQSKAIPLIREGRDLLGKSHTGTGKTLAFGIPAVECIDGRGVQVIVISPTRELAMQTAEEFRKLTKYTENIRIVTVYGGQPIQNQISQLKRGAEIVIGTPGRLLDHLKRKTIHLDSVKMAVLDEADEMLNMGFREDMENILNRLPENHQTLLFSATMPAEIQEIAGQYQKDPAVIQVGSEEEKTIDTVEQYYYQVPRGHKPDALALLLYHQKPKTCIVFCNTKKKTDELCRYLNQRHFNAAALHGDMKQEARTAVMQSVKAGQTPILIATDVAARGIDVHDISAVYNFDLPQDFESYIHRIGRTGRAGKKGISYTLVCGQLEYANIQSLQKYTGVKIQQQSLPQASEIAQGQQEALYQRILEQAKNINPENRQLTDRLLASGLSSEQLCQTLIQMLLSYEIGEIPELPNPKKKERVAEKKHPAAPAGYTHLRFSLGKKHRVAPNHILAAIAEATRIPGDRIEKIRCFQDYSLVEVPLKFRNLILSKVDGTKIQGKPVKVSLYEEDVPAENARPKQKRTSQSAHSNTNRNRKRRR
jgi:ATP-dependent RNA helicase DeaD